MSKFWTEDITQLLAFNGGMVPRQGQSIADNLNAITRMAIIACIVIALFKPVLAVSTFIVAVIIVLAIFYGITETPKEGFVELAGNLFTAAPSQFPVTRQRFCNDLRPIQFDEEYISQNQLLVGGPNPKTLIAPIVAPPSHELSAWKTSDLTVHSSINDATNYDAYASGYVGDAFNFDAGYSGYVTRCSNCVRAPCVCRNPLTRSDQILTQTIQPGVYEKSDYSEPINALIGISQQKQFDNTRICSDACGVTYDAISRTHLAPITVRETDHLQTDIQTNLQTESDVYDPRFTGYGPTDRGYLEPVTGQPRFFYDDINAVTMPNFIARSNVDIYPWAAQYGSGMNGNLSDGGVAMGDGYKQLAENAFLDATIKFRTELQERLLRKRNAEMWQRRVAPIL